jgi:pyruvate dehydrogenase phosphatase
MALSSRALRWKELNLSQATALLEANAGVYRYGARGQFYVATYGSNDPSEDDFDSTSDKLHKDRTASNPTLLGQRTSVIGQENWPMWGIYDGHEYVDRNPLSASTGNLTLFLSSRGFATSALLRQKLIPAVQYELLGVNPKWPIDISALQRASAPDPARANNAIKRAFTNLDAEIMDSAWKAVTTEAPPTDASVRAALDPATAGSCALLAIYDTARSTLRVACTGDSRAVLGRYDPAACKYTANPMSEDQTGFNNLEQERIYSEHPGERYIFEGHRFLGIGMIRAFGDHRLKWSELQIKEAQRKFRRGAPRPWYKTPPYMTAEPVVMETDVNTGPRGDFLVMASDGVWDHISSEDAIECVAQWIDWMKAGKPGTSTPKEASSNGPPVSWFDVKWKTTPEYFVVEDENAAVHLIKNAFGGSGRDLFCGVMTASPPSSRGCRDDVTVQIIFFGDTDFQPEPL